MSAARLLGGGSLANPLGLEVDPSGGIWVDDADHQRFVRFVNEAQDAAVPGDEGRAWGGIGIDRDGDLMWAGWDQQQALHFSKPTPQAAYVKDGVFLQSENGGGFNRTTARGFNGGKGLEVTADQLIYGDGSRILFWNNPQSLTNYQPADGVVGMPDFTTRERWGPWFERMRADGRGRLWALRGNFNGATLYGYQLSLRTGAAPIYTINSPLPLLGGGTIAWSPSVYLSGIEVQPSCDCVWVADEDNHRVLRIRNVTTQPVVDIVLGQLNAAGMSCNQGRGRDFPLRNSLCNPGALAFDKAGNLYLADHNTEFDGNLRLLEFDAGALPAAPTTAAFGIPATRVFGRNGNFTAPNCLPFDQDPMCGPWEPAFDGNGLMVVGFNGYLGPRFPMIYKNPLSNPLPVAALGDYQSQPTSARFDQFGNLYMLDHNRSRILIYHGVYAQPSAPTATATPMAKATPTRTPTTTVTVAPSVTSTPTPIPSTPPDDQDRRVFLPSVRR